MPAALPPVVNHGDFRLGNALCEGDRLNAVIDWEIWSVGDPRIDLAWLTFFTDDARHPAVAPGTIAGTPTRREIVLAYEEASGRQLPELGWFDALTRYKEAGLTGLLLKHALKVGRPLSDSMARMQPALPGLVQEAISMLTTPRAVGIVRTSPRADHHAPAVAGNNHRLGIDHRVAADPGGCRGEVNEGGRADLASRWRLEGRWADRTLPEDMRHAAREYPASSVVYHSSTGLMVTTVADLYARALRAAAGLARLGVRPGDAVAIQVPNWPEGAVAHAAGWLAGAVVVPIVPIYGPREVGFILRQSVARIFIVARHWRDRDCAGLLAGLGELAALSHVVVIGRELPGTVAWNELENDPEPAAAGFSPPAVDPGDPCLLVYTSGTTAEPKGVRHSHNTLLSEVHSSVFVRDATSAVKQLAAFPAGHVAGVLGLLRVLVLGTPSVVMDAWDPVAAARLVEEHRVTAGIGAPIYLATLLDEAERAGRDLSSLTGYLTGGRVSIPRSALAFPPTRWSSGPPQTGA